MMLLFLAVCSESLLDNVSKRIFSLLNAADHEESVCCFGFSIWWSLKHSTSNGTLL